MLAELGNKQGERITVSDNGTFDRYIADGWCVLSITTESKEDGKSTTKKTHETRQKGRQRLLK